MAPASFDFAQWFALTLLAMLSVLLLPRQFQMMVVECVDERHLRRAAWVFPAYLLLINVFVLPIAIGGLVHLRPRKDGRRNFVLSLPLAYGAPALAVFAYVGGLSAATGMLIVETVAVATMVCNDLVMPALLRLLRFGGRRQRRPDAAAAEHPPRRHRRRADARLPRTSASPAKPMRWSASA